jgi:hypothetical protein
MQTNDNIEQVFREVETHVKRLLNGESDAKKATLTKIFKLNNEIGKVARTDRFNLEALKPLQTQVNAITVAVKSGNLKLMEESLKYAGNLIEKTKEIRK